MGELPNISSPAINAGLLRLVAMRKERRKKDLECILESFDVVAAAWLEAQGTLSEVELNFRIPELVFEAAVEFGWVQYPPQREVQRRRIIPDAWIPGAPVIDWVSVSIPESELVEEFGRFRVETGFTVRFRRLLAGRIAYWQAEVLTRADSGSFQKRERAGDTGSSDLAVAQTPRPVETMSAERKAQTGERAAKVAKESRARTVAKLIHELDALKPQMFVDDDKEYKCLHDQYPDFLAFRIAETRPDLKKKILAIQGSSRHIRLAQELAAAHHGKTLSTIQDDWKDYKPAEFRRQP